MHNDMESILGNVMLEKTYLVAFRKQKKTYMTTLTTIMTLELNSPLIDIHTLPHFVYCQDDKQKMKDVKGYSSLFILSIIWAICTFSIFILSINQFKW